MQSVGYHRAFDLATTGRKVGAKEAKEIGLVAEVVSEQEWEHNVQEIAVSFSKKATLAISLMKRSLQRAYIQDLAATLASEAEEQTILGHSADFAEGVTAFMQKRAPHFKGK
jgi:2-(1,2-epoxy-1,2-dihydrophenyl)acetyl-CoA isomerase